MTDSGDNEGSVTPMGARTQESPDGVLEPSLEASASYWQQWREARLAGAQPADVDEQTAWDKATDDDYQR